MAFVKENLNSFIFICLGNICRSPIAEGYFRSLTQGKNAINGISVGSGGLATSNDGKPADPRAITLASNYGFDLSHHRARVIEEYDLERYHYFVCMDEDTQKNLKRKFPSLSNSRLPLLLDYTSDYSNVSVPDPFLGNDKDFENTMSFIRHGIHGMIQNIISNNQNADA